MKLPLPFSRRVLVVLSERDVSATLRPRSGLVAVSPVKPPASALRHDTPRQAVRS